MKAKLKQKTFLMLRMQDLTIRRVYHKSIFPLRRARLKEHPLPEWPKIFSLVMGCPFLLGENDRGRRADFNWTMKPANLIKILEGNYSRTKAMSKRERMMQETDEILQKFTEKIELDDSDNPLTNALQIGSGRADEDKVSGDRDRIEPEPEPEPENPKPENSFISCPGCGKETARVDIEKLGCCPGCQHERMQKGIRELNRKLSGEQLTANQHKEG